MKSPRIGPHARRPSVSVKTLSQVATAPWLQASVHVRDESMYTKRQMIRGVAREKLR